MEVDRRVFLGGLAGLLVAPKVVVHTPLSFTSIRGSYPLGELYRDRMFVVNDGPPAYTIYFSEVPSWK